MITEQLTHFIVDKAEDMKATDIAIIDVREKSSITDFMVICSGNSKRHVMSIAENVVKNARQEAIPSFGTDGEQEGEWVVVDLGNVMLHVMQNHARELYQLEKLWN